MSINHLTTLAHAYAAHTGLALSTVSTRVANDGKFFRRLDEGAGVTVGRANRIMRWFCVNWPEDLEWPQGIPRPSRQRRRAA